MPVISDANVPKIWAQAQSGNLFLHLDKNPPEAE